MEIAKKQHEVRHVGVKNYGDKETNLSDKDEDIGSSNVVKDRVCSGTFCIHCGGR